MPTIRRRAAGGAMLLLALSLGACGGGGGGTPPVNAPPAISGTPQTSALEDEAYAFTPDASDPDGDAISFSIANAPAWSSFDTATGRLAGTPTNADVGSYPGIVISASDGEATASLPTFAIEVVNVNDAPQISGTPATTVEEDRAYAFTPTALDEDAGDSLSFSIENRPAWATFEPATGTLTGTPGDGDGGVYLNIVIAVSDGRTNVALPGFDIEVVPFTELAFSGTVTDSPVANATITGTFGDQTFETTADAAGAYTVELRLRDADIDPTRLVTLTAQGVAEQATTELTSVLGSLTQLVAAAGPGETLAADEYPRLNVTQVSTARELLAVDFNGGAVPSTAEALAAAETAIPAGTLLDLAALIRLIVDQDLIAIAEGATVRDVLLPTMAGQTQREAIDALLAAEGLTDGAGEPTPAFAAALDEARAATLGDGDVTAGFDVDALLGTSVWGVAAAPGQLLRDIGAKTVVELAADGTGVLWQQREESINLRGRKIRTQAIDFTWNASDSFTATTPLDLTFDAADAQAAAVTVTVPLARRQQLADDLGFAQAVVDFIDQAIAGGDPVPDPIPVREVRRARRATALSVIDGTVQAIVEDQIERDLDELLTALAWPEPLPLVSATVEEALVIETPGAAAPLADDIASAQSWALPIEFDLGAAGGTPPGIAADVFTLRQDGTTSTGSLSGASFAWNLVDGALVLSPVEGDMASPPVTTYTFERLERLAGIDHVLVTVTVDGETTLRFTDWAARAQPTREAFIPVLTAQPPPAFWQPVTGAPSVGGPRSDRSEAYSADGLLDPEFVSGWIFRENLSAVLFEGDDATCLSDDSRGCFDETGVWTYTASPEASRISLVGDLVFFDREVEWLVLQYAADTGTAVVLEYEFSITVDEQTSEVSRETRAPPRVNRLDLATLADYPEELADAQAQGFLAN